MNYCLRFIFLASVILVSVFILFVLFTNNTQSERSVERRKTRAIHNREKQKVTFDDIVTGRKKFNFEDRDLMILLHIQKTGGTTFEKHLVQDLNINNQCSCSDEKRRCWCPRYSNQKVTPPSTPSVGIPTSNVTWLISRFSTGWICGLHADWTQLTNCLSGLERLYFLTFVRDPIHRFISEFRHVQRGATWKNSRKHCKDYDTQLCYGENQSDWSNVTLDEFLNCPNNMALNRQTRMLADHNLIKCSNDNNSDEELLLSAKKNLREMAFFGICDEQLQSQIIFEKTFGLKFKRKFVQSNESRAIHQAKALSDGTRWKILKLNSLDVELYKYASILFQERYNRLSLK